ncbi:MULTISPECIES: FAD-binding oxidoreductase [unclassified Pseudomonas]|uniref:NAD(P)/FAD-dependent oxidoreductase n=1 Tax=unclassified Pseudomonas TaxID=196821 RepID=UPI00088E9282|nr:MULTISPECIES: FAD-dependent oxidoreductase [unclassified Pseudomonas]UVL58815.1 FAD-binding oxidoreductase [Pseudomonas sp. B21-035]SDQ71644.1 Glycine/D-amino acid oxidase [Pseudomonas sp. UC 17F4]
MKALACEMAIIGAGYCGLSAAIELAGRGFGVRVFERGEWAGNASAFNFGSVAAMPPALPNRDAQGSQGADAQQRLRAVLEPISELKRQIDTFEYDCQWRQPGHITLAMDDDAARTLKQRHAEASTLFGGGVHWLDARQVSAQTAAQGVVAGLLNEHFALIDPAGLLLAMRNHAQALGVRIDYSSPVLALDPQADSVNLQLPAARVNAARVLIASEEAWGLCTEAALQPLTMFQTHLCESQVLGARDLQLISRRARVYGTATADKDYFRVHHGRLLFGSRLGLVPLDASPQAVVAALQARLAGYFPSLAAIPVARVWSGSLGFTDNGLPRLGASGPVAWGGGYCGSGIATAVQCGRQLARMATEAGVTTGSQPMQSHQR